MTRVLAPLFLVALAGCGGGGGSEQDDAERTVRDFIQASNARDTGKLCDHLLSQQFVEQTTLAWARSRTLNSAAYFAAPVTFATPSTRDVAVPI